MKAVTNLQNTVLATFDQVRNAIHPQIRLLIGSTMFGLLTALSAQAAIRLPFTPVPVTGQVFVVLLAGAVLGPKWAALSQIQYLAIGAAGAPVFAGGTSGLLPFVGPSGGYLVGFVAAAWVTGTIWCRLPAKWGGFIANLAGLLTIYLFGWFWLGLWLGMNSRGQDAWAQAFGLGVAPFAAVDMLKAACATVIGHLYKTAGKCLESGRTGT